VKTFLWVGGLALVGASLLASCASTTMVNSWADPAYADGKLGKVLIIGVAKNAALRRQFEDSFVRSLQSKKVPATSSYQALPDPAEINVASLEPIVRDQGITHVLVTRFVDRKTVTSYVPPSVTTYAPAYPAYYHGGWYGYYGASYSTVVSPGYTYETEYVHLETNVYDVASNKLIWSGVTETELGGTAQNHVAEFIGVVTTYMARDKLI
jgi:hypothetical protein